MLATLHIILDQGRLTDEESVGERVVSHVVTGRVCKHPENDKTADRRALGGQVSFLSDGPALEDVSVLRHGNIHKSTLTPCTHKAMILYTRDTSCVA